MEKRTENDQVTNKKFEEAEIDSNKEKVKTKEPMKSLTNTS